MVVSAINGDVLAAYKLANAELIKNTPDFAAWLERDYRPIVGGWQY
jgi:hypothetical protein